MKPKQENPPPEPDPVDPSSEEPKQKLPKLKKLEPAKEPTSEEEKSEGKEIRKLKLKSAITPLYNKPKPPPQAPGSETTSQEHHIEIPHAEQIPIEEIAPPTAEEMEGMSKFEEAPPQPMDPPVEQEQQQAPAEDVLPQIPLPKETQHRLQTKEELTQEPEPQPQPEVKTLVKAKEPEKKRSKRPFILVGGIAAIGIIVVGYFLLDPFGHSLEPIRPMSPVRAENTAGEVSEATPQEAIVEEEVPFDPESIDLDTYLAGLTSRHIQVIPNPEGVLIDKVFFAQGGLLNPHLDLVIKDIEVSSSEVLLTVTDSNSVDHTIPLQRSN
ncbi:MAG: hypothetical protein AB3N63_02845 [Puniceicoccaceae bacterium]